MDFDSYDYWVCFYIQKISKDEDTSLVIHGPIYKVLYFSCLLCSHNIMQFNHVYICNNYKRHYQFKALSVVKLIEQNDMHICNSQMVYNWCQISIIGCMNGPPIMYTYQLNFVSIDKFLKFII